MIVNNFPYARLPESVQHVVSEVQAQTQAPPDLVCLVALGVASLAAQYSVAVEGGDGSTTAVALNIFVAADSGERKTTVFKRLLKSVTEFEATKREQGREHVLRHKALHDAWTAQVAGLKRRITKEYAEDGASCSDVAVAEQVISDALSKCGHFFFRSDRYSERRHVPSAGPSQFQLGWTNAIARDDGRAHRCTLGDPNDHAPNASA